MTTLAKALAGTLIAALVFGRPALSIAGQGSDDSTLEIVPQSNLPPTMEGGGQAPAAPSSARDENGASAADDVDSLSRKDAASHPRAHPYLGISVGYTTEPYPGTHERGIEVLSVDPSSPAEKAGLKPRTGMTAAGTLGKTASDILGPLNFLTKPLLTKTGSFGQRGDLIVALNDRPVASPLEMDDVLAGLGPGDTLYLTVIRTVSETECVTLKFAVKLGGTRQEADTSRAGAPQPPITY